MLLLDNPAAIKQLSHKIKISEKEEKQWYDSYAKKVMMKGVFEEFNQNSALEKYLIESTETKIAEASGDPFLLSVWLFPTQI